MACLYRCREGLAGSRGVIQARGDQLPVQHGDRSPFGRSTLLPVRQGMPGLVCVPRQDNRLLRPRVMRRWLKPPRLAAWPTILFPLQSEGRACCSLIRSSISRRGLPLSRGVVAGHIGEVVHRSPTYCSSGPRGSGYLRPTSQCSMGMGNFAKQILPVPTFFLGLTARPPPGRRGPPKSNRWSSYLYKCTPAQDGLSPQVPNRTGAFTRFLCIPRSRR